MTHGSLSLAELTSEERALVEIARAAAGRAYCRYSNYPVGAAIVSETGRIFSGCNVENASYGVSMCAERAAIFAMVSAGERQITRVCVYASGDATAMPCGSCRQVIAEFCLDAPVLVAGPSSVLRRRFADLLPEAFRLLVEAKP